MLSVIWTTLGVQERELFACEGATRQEVLSCNDRLQKTGGHLVIQELLSLLFVSALLVDGGEVDLEEVIVHVVFSLVLVDDKISRLVG